MSFRRYCLIFLFSLLSLQARTQQITTGDRQGAVSVENGTGLLTFYSGLLSKGGKKLSKPSGSFLSIQTPTATYTNNPLQTTATQLLSGATTKHDDSIFTRWTEPDIEITQVIYPALIHQGIQFAVRIYARARTSSVGPVSAQYLLDLEIDTAKAPMIATTRSFSNGGVRFSNSDSVPMPVFFTASESRDFASGWQSEGRWIDSSLALRPPSFVTIDNSSLLGSPVFGHSAQLGPDSTGDNALLMEWPSSSLDTSRLTEAASFSYGTSTAIDCFPDLLFFTPPVFRSGRSSNGTMLVTLFAFNSRGLSDYTKGFGTLNVEGNTTIVFPLDTMYKGTQQTQAMSPPNTPRGHFSQAQWTVSLGPLDVDSYGKLTTTVNSLGRDGPSSCVTNVNPRLEFIDTTYPISVVLSQHGGDTTSCGTQCYDVAMLDTGKHASGLALISPVYLQNMTLVVDSFEYGAREVHARICVIDTLIKGEGVTAETDAAGHLNEYQYDYCPVRDTLPPVITYVNTLNRTHVVITDNRPWDSELDWIAISDTSNVTITSPDTIKARARIEFDATRRDTNLRYFQFCVIAADRVGNLSRKICVHNDAKAGVFRHSVPSHLMGIFPNPSSGTTRFRFDTPKGNFTIYDLLGRAWIHADLHSDSYELASDALPGGEYIVRYSSSKGIVSQRLSVGR